MTVVEMANAGWVAFCILIWLCHWFFEQSTILSKIYEILGMLSAASGFIASFFAVRSAWNGDWYAILSFWSPLLLFPVFLFTERKPSSSALIAVPGVTTVIIGSVLGITIHISQRDASYTELLSGTLLQSSPAPSSAVPFLRRGHFVILQSEPGSPQALHYVGNHGFPVPASPADVENVIVVVRRNDLLAPPAGMQWVFNSTVFDVRSKRALVSSLDAGGTGSYQALGGVSASGDQPWTAVEQWVSTLIGQ